MAPAHDAGMQGERTGLLIIRAWLEPGSREPLRVHVRQTTDVAGGFDGASTLTDSDGVVAAVRGWLDRVLAEA